MFNSRIKGFDKLKKDAVPEEALDRGRIKLLAYMSVHPMIRPATQPSWFARAFIWKPMVAGAVVTMALSGAGGAVFASASSLPGERLYRVKRWSEEVRATFALSADSKFWLRAEQAERRLSEAEAVMVMQDKDEEHPDRAAQVKKAMDAYAAHVVDMKATAPESFAAAMAVDRVLERHELLVDAAIEAEERDAVVFPLQASIDLDTELREILTAAQHDIELNAKARAERKTRRDHDKEERHEVVGDVSHDGGHDKGSHDHVDVESIDAPEPPITLDLDGGIEAKTDINTNLNLRIKAEPTNVFGR